MASSGSVPSPLAALLQPFRRAPPSQQMSSSVLKQPQRLQGIARAIDARASFSRGWSIAMNESPQAVMVPRSLPVRVAHELLLAGHKYLDVRTVDEFNAGHAVGAINIPYMLKFGSGMTKNPRFLEQVFSVFGMDDEIIVGCQSGKRSLLAAAELCSAGFTGVTDIAGGYSAWAQIGLPIQQ